MMGEDEPGTVARVGAVSDLLGRLVAKAGGRVFSRAGDGFLAEFNSPVAAVQTANDLQNALATPQAQADIGVSLRIGVHTADVIAEGDDLLGDGVNIAARLESAAEPGRVYLSAPVFDYVKRTAGLRFDNLGGLSLKNISEPVKAYRVAGDLGVHSCQSANDLETTASPSGRERKPRSIVVLPLRNQSADPDQEYFADGITEDIITELSRFGEIFTISRNASLRLKGAELDTGEVGRRLGVRYVLEGGVRKLGSRVWINCYLSDSVSGDQVWSDKHDFNVEDIFDVQDELVSKIVASVAGRIERETLEGAQRKRPADLEAYDCLLRGLEYHRLGGITRENAELALSWFDRALELDPGFGRAYAWRACSLATVAEWTGKDVWDELVQLGRKALELDDTDAEVHRIAGSLALYERNYDRSKYHFQRAIEMNPHHPFLVARMGEVWNFMGDGAEALKCLRRAQELDPFLPVYCRELEAVAHFVLEDYAECYRCVEGFNRASRRAAAYQLAAAVRLGDPDKIEKARARLLRRDAGFDPAVFVTSEFHSDRDVSRALREDLSKGLAAGLRLAS